MKKAIKLIAAAAAGLLLASCSTVYRSSYSPDVTQLNLEMSDLIYYGETEISVVYDTYLGIFSRIDQVNGEKYDGKVQQFTNLHTNAPLSRKLNRAAYKALEVYPEANYFIVTSQKVVKETLFLGSERVVTAKVRAYRIK